MKTSRICIYINNIISFIIIIQFIVIIFYLFRMWNGWNWKQEYDAQLEELQTYAIKLLHFVCGGQETHPIQFGNFGNYE